MNVQRLKRFLLLTVACVGVLEAQGITVLKQVFTAQTTVTVSAPLRNAGQQYHHIDVYATGNNGGIGTFCGNATGLLFLEGSGDSINWIPIGVPITSLSPYINAAGGPVVYNYYASVSAPGAYTYTRLNYKSTFASGGTCALTVNYSGTSSNVNNSSTPYTAFADNFMYLTGSKTTASKVTLASCPVGGSPLQVYGLILSSAVANTATLAAYYGSTGGTAVWTYNVAMGVNTNVTLPPAIRPYFYTTSDATRANFYSLTLTLSGATEVDYSISYRCE